MLKDTPLKSKDSITKNLLVLNICSWHQLVEHVKNLPYSRNSNRSDLKFDIKQDSTSLNLCTILLIELSINL